MEEGLEVMEEGAAVVATPVVLPEAQEAQEAQEGAAVPEVESYISKRQVLITVER